MRSDERIREDISDRLADHDWVDASEVEVMVKSGEVTLSGTVTDRRHKREIEDVAERIAGVRDVHNQIRVIREEMRGREGQHGMTGGTGTTTTGTKTTPRA